jgi:hypothetical protein
VQRWEDGPVRQCDVQRERSGREDRRLNSIYTPIDMTSLGHGIERVAHTVHVKMVAFIRINGLVEQRGRERERRLVKHISFGTEFLNHSTDVQRAPRDHRMMEHG